MPKPQMTEREIAESLGISRASVRQYLARAIAKLSRNEKLRQIVEDIREKEHREAVDKSTAYLSPKDKYPR